jgi:hypothetical protein
MDGSKERLSTDILQALGSLLPEFIFVFCVFDGLSDPIELIEALKRHIKNIHVGHSYLDKFA